MSKNDILKHLRKLTPKARQEIRAKLDENDGLTDADWVDDGELTDEERRRRRSTTQRTSGQTFLA